MEKPKTSEKRAQDTFPEFAKEQELLQDPSYEHKSSGRLWYWNIVDGVPFDAERKARMLIAQKRELPYLVSGVLERTCNLQCDHCLYQEEKSSSKESARHELFETIERVVSQMPEAKEGYGPTFMSAGRILRPSHLELFTKLRTARPDVKLGVIDNGTYTKLLPQWPDGFKFDWIDISIDGTEEEHNKQRASKRAYAVAINGLKHAREVVRSKEEGGYVSSLLTLSSLNSENLPEVARTLLEKQESGLPLVDKLKFTTMSPTNPVNSAIEMSVEDLRRAWEGIKEICAEFNSEEQRVDLGIYRVQDIEKLAAAVGEKKFLEAFPNDEAEAASRVTAEGNFIATKLDGVPLSYLPLSIWPPEEFLIDADAAYRVAYEGQFTLKQLQSGRAKDGRDTRPFTTAQLTPESDFRGSFEQTVELYWKNFGAKRLEEEFQTFQRIKAKAGLA